MPTNKPSTKKSTSRAAAPRKRAVGSKAKSTTTRRSHSPALRRDSSTSGSLILQWLTYAFWGWCVVVIGFATGVVANYFYAGRDAVDWSEPVAYSLAALVVLAIVALVTDLLYTRREPVVKTGVASMLMLVHTVIFVLAAIGLLILGLFAGIALMISSSPVDGYDGELTKLTASLVTAVLFAVLSGRVLWGTRRPRLALAARGVLIVSTIAVTALGIVGPLVTAQSTRGDRAIEQYLPVLANQINAYAGKHDKLPLTLRDVEGDSSDISRGVGQLIRENRVRYTPNTKAPREVPKSAQSNTDIVVPGEPTNGSRKVYSYRLCVDYVAARNQSAPYGQTDMKFRVGSDTSPDTYTHGKGEQCYDLTTDYLPVTQARPIGL